jgi:hypothetical protein
MACDYDCTILPNCVIIIFLVILRCQRMLVGSRGSWALDDDEIIVTHQTMST